MLQALPTLSFGPAFRPGRKPVCPPTAPALAADRLAPSPGLAERTALELLVRFQAARGGPLSSGSLLARTFPVYAANRADVDALISGDRRSRELPGSQVYDILLAETDPKSGTHKMALAAKQLFEAGVRGYDPLGKFFEEGPFQHSLNIGDAEVARRIAAMAGGFETYGLVFPNETAKIQEVLHGLPGLSSVPIAPRTVDGGFGYPLLDPLGGLEVTLPATDATAERNLANQMLVHQLDRTRAWVAEPRAGGPAGSARDVIANPAAYTLYTRAGHDYVLGGANGLSPGAVMAAAARAFPGAL